MSVTNDNNNAFLIHISAFAGYVFPFGSVLLPLILWNVRKDKSPELDKHGKGAVNFNLSYYLYSFTLGITLVPFTFGTLFSHLSRFGNLDHFNFNMPNIFGFIGFSSLFSFLILAKFILIVVAAVKASRGELYHYPLSIKFLK
ncbi:MAG: DUF4870 domain-containing protein [Flavobacteriaceae bacterium]|nr:DUF4870 domain-containing protein [Flavobacteriaceae bacterium]